MSKKVALEDNKNLFSSMRTPAVASSPLISAIGSLKGIAGAPSKALYAILLVYPFINISKPMETSSIGNSVSGFETRNCIFNSVVFKYSLVKRVSIKLSVSVFVKRNKSASVGSR